MSHQNENKKHEEKETLPPLAARWKIIFRYLAPYKKELWFLSFVGIISALASGTVPYIIGRFMGTLVTPASFLILGEQVPAWILFLVLFGLIQIIADIATWINDVRGSLLGTSIHGSFLARGRSFLLTLPFSFYKNAKPGEVSDKISRSARLVGQLSEHILVNLAHQFLSIIVGLGVMIALNRFLSLIIITGICAYGLLLAVMVRPLAEKTHTAGRSWGKAEGYCNNIIANMQAIKQVGSEEYERKAIIHKWDYVVQLRTGVEKIWRNISYAQGAIMTVTRLAIFGFSTYFITQGSLNLGELIAFNGYAALVFRPFTVLGRSWSTVENALSAVVESDEILSQQPEPYTRPNGVDAGAQGKVEFRNVSFRYSNDDPLVLKGITFTAHPGEIIAFVGKTGAGKSTVIDLLSGYYEAHEGEVLVDDHDVRTINLAALRSHIAVVPQEVALFDDTIRANIRYGSFGATDAQVENVAKEAHIDEFVEKLPKRYEQEVGHRGIKLSGGQKQRVAIARAMLRDPQILVLDEPTSALDAKTEQFISESLDRLMEGRTTFIVAHRLSTVRKAHRILFIEDGRIVEEGSHDELLAKEDGKYRAMYELHIGSHKDAVAEDDGLRV